MTRVVIVDDEPSARETLKVKLQMYCPYVEVVGEASGVNEGINLIIKKKPDVALLDVEMKDGTGFDILKKTKDPGFRVIFTTAHEEYAIDAFRFSAIDYLLKPVDSEDLERAFAKLNDTFNRKNQLIKLSAFMSNIESETSEKIVLRTFDNLHVVKISEVVRCQAKGNYTEFYVSGKKKIMVSRTLMEYDDMLSNHQFMRIHQSHLINLNFIERFSKNSSVVVMADGAEVPVALRRKELLMTYLDSL